MPLAETVRGELGDLAALHDPHAHPAAVELPLQLVDPRGQLFDAHVVVVADVRRRAHGSDPVALGFARHRDAVSEVERAVVERRQDVAVQVDHRRRSQLGGCGSSRARRG